ncbi:TPA: phage protease, partial [Escherichia coli]
DGRTWINRNPHEVVARSSDIKIPVDIEHATEIKGPRGEDAPAYGWVEELRVTDSSTIEGRVVWSESARWMLSERRYRYYSPAFFFDADGAVTRLSSVGLTNKPNLDFPALNTEKNPMTVPVQITGLLGLAESATVDDTVAAIKQLQENEQVALNRAQTPDLTKFVPVETHNLALNRAETAEQRLQQLEAKEAEALVDAAIEAGKVAPANRDMFLATCRTEEGRKQFAEYTRGAQPLVNNDKPSQGKDKP